MKTAFPYFCLLLASLVAPAQKEANHWYFGPGLDFSAGAPVPDNNGRTNPGEGCATICDENGNLLFYTLRKFTDFDTIYNRLHQPMANGGGILGDCSSVQSSLIVKKPGSNNIYYLFSQTGGGAISMLNGLYYNEVDMSLASGNGSVTVKNVPVYTNGNFGLTECLAGIKHCNGTDYWVMVRETTPYNKYRSYLISSAGVSTVGVVSIVGPQYNNGQSLIKFSPTGKKMSLCTFGQNAPCLFDFNASTGIISNPLILNATGNFSEFSPDGTKFYAHTEDGISAIMQQWDLCSGTTSTSIFSSKHTFTIGPAVDLDLGDMQLAPDGKIYLTSYTYPQNYSISVIGSPNLSGSSCNFIRDGQSVGNRVANWALPNFIGSYFKNISSSFTHTNESCNTVQFSTPAFATAACASNAYTGVNWNFGDPSSGTNNSSSSASPSHNFTAPGTYTVKLALLSACSADTLYKVITVAPQNTMQASSDKTICAREKVILSASGAVSYSWSTGASQSTIAVTPVITTSYVVTATLSGNCVSTKTIVITAKDCVRISEQQTGFSLKIFPSPAKEELTVESEKSGELYIYDLTGRILHKESKMNQSIKINVSRILPGVYLVLLKGELSTAVERIYIE